MNGYNIRIFLNDKELVSSYLVLTLGNSFAYDFQRLKQEITQVKLALQNKLSLVCMTQLDVSAQGIFKTGILFYFLLYFTESSSYFRALGLSLLLHFSDSHHLKFLKWLMGTYLCLLISIGNLTFCCSVSLSCEASLQI